MALSCPDLKLIAENAELVPWKRGLQPRDWPLHRLQKTPKEMLRQVFDSSGQPRVAKIFRLIYSVLVRSCSTKVSSFVLFLSYLPVVRILEIGIVQVTVD